MKIRSCRSRRTRLKRAATTLGSNRRGVPEKCGVCLLNIRIGFKSNFNVFLMRRRVLRARQLTLMQVLYNPNDMEPHVALQIIEKIVRLMQV
jgi:hypothetical protein